MISDILDISKIEAGHVTLYLENFPVDQLIEDVITTATPLAEKNNNVLKVKTKANIGTMYADMPKVRQILLNLLSNASKFTEKGTIYLIAERTQEKPPIPEDDEDASADFFAAYWRIGTTSLGDALCIDERADGVVVLLDCEWGFYAQQFVNTSVGHLLLCLEAWRALESDTSDDVDGIIERFASAVERVDPAALTEGAFWSDMLDALEDDGEDDEEDNDA
jgi:hypothetical protein